MDSESPVGPIPEQLRRQSLAAEVARAAGLTDRERVEIMRDLYRTAEAIAKSKSPEDRLGDREARRRLEEEPGRARYRAAYDRLT